MARSTMPRGAAHTYRNSGAQPSQHWIITTPAGFERFFGACAAAFAASANPEPEAITAIHHAHGISLLG